jgi:nucleoside-triphosphatase THEP1
MKKKKVSIEQVGVISIAPKIVNGVKRTLVASGFPGTGKTTCAKNTGEKVLDSGWSKFNNDEFPSNYMNHIQDNLGKADIIFVSFHDAVRQAMRLRGIDYVLIYPDRSLKDEYLERFKKRGNPESFIRLLDENWNSFIDSMEADKNEAKIILKSGEYISDYLKP